MTRKHYGLMANAIRQTTSSLLAINRDNILSDKEDIEAEMNGLAHKFSDIFWAENPNFDKVRFLNACGFKR